MTIEDLKVLLVEDDDSMREAVERLLGAAGFECAAYASAEAMLAGSALIGAGCVVSDLKLPSMSGLDLLAHLRSHGTSSPFIMITAHDVPGLRAEAMQRGASDYLVKPFRGTALLAAIRAATGRAPVPPGENACPV